jgi:rRNA processing protein Krr1/Pno1
MNEDNYYLRIERDNDQETVAILGNKKGLEYLKDCIEDLLEDIGSLPKDISLEPPSNGGIGLSEENEDPTSPDCTRIDHLRLYRWK